MTNRFNGWRGARMLGTGALVLLTACSGGGATSSQTTGAAAASSPAIAATAPATSAPAVATVAPEATAAVATSAGADTRTVAEAATTSAAGQQTTAADTSSVAATTTASGNATGAASGSTASQGMDGDFRTAIRRVNEKVRPAVVQITNLQTVRSQQFNQPFTVPAGVGSGVIYDNQGHILTNNHVIQGAEQLQVSLPGGESYPAKLIGADPQTDLAVVQVTGKNLPVAALGDSSKLQVGDWLVAIGNALGLQGGPTVSEGVVSALGRTVQEPGNQTSGGQTAAGPYLFDVIQTDTPINPGNSGGPLLNLDGEVIGINTLVAGQAEPGVQAQGIGFAIAINTVKPIADELVKNGRVVHPFLGISYGPLNPAIAAQLNIKTTNGFVVGDVVQGSPAAQAGIQQGDVITAADGQELKGESALAYALNKHKPGDQITLTILRQGKTTEVKATLAERPQQ